MADLFNETEGAVVGGIEITLEKDIPVFKKVVPNGRLMYREKSAIQKGETIVVGGADEMVSFSYDHKIHQFTPWLDNPDAVEDDEASVRYIRTGDLPSKF